MAASSPGARISALAPGVDGCQAFPLPSKSLAAHQDRRPGHRGIVHQGTGMSVLMPQVTAFVVFVLDCRICQSPVLGRNTVRSLVPSPS